MANKVTVTKKDKALELMKRLDIYKPYIKGFKDKDLVCFFERYAGFWDYQEPEIEAKRKELENKYNILIYAITHEFIEGDEMYSFLYVPNDVDEREYALQEATLRKYYAMAYVWNKSCEWCSELGDVMIESAYGGIRRVA